MGYTMELWALSVRALVDELRSPTLTVSDIRRQPGFGIEDWSAQARAVAEILDRGGDELTSTRALYVAAVIRTLGEPLDSLEHTSSGGEEFRDLLEGPGARRLGPELVTHLRGRQLGGATWDDYPVIGWASHDELRATRELLPTHGEIDPAGDPYEQLFALELAIGRADSAATDLVTIYL